MQLWNIGAKYVNIALMYTEWHISNSLKQYHIRSFYYIFSISKWDLLSLKEINSSVLQMNFDVSRSDVKSSTFNQVCIYRVSQEERTKLREGVPYVKLHRYNPKHLYPKLNGYWDNGQIKLWTSFGSTNDSCQVVSFIYIAGGCSLLILLTLAWNAYPCISFKVI
jgi:hypothetical protein